MKRVSTLAVIIVILIMAFGGLLWLSFYSKAKLNNLNEAKTNVNDLLRQWSKVESLTKELLITDNLAQTRIPWVAARYEFGENLNSFTHSPITQLIQAKDAAFAEKIKTLGMLWELTKKRLTQADLHLEKYLSLKKDYPFTGNLLDTFGELRATRRYSVELKEFIEDLKWGASLSDDSFVMTLTDLVNRMSANIRVQIHQLRTNALLLSVMIILAVGLLAAHRTMEFARSREQYRKHAAALAKEIEERKKLEQARRESEDRFSQMAENIYETFWMTEPESSKFLYISPAYEKIWRRPCSELYKNPRKWTEYVHSDDLKILKAHWKKQSKGKATYEEFRIILPDGSIRWIANRAYPIKNYKGDIVRITGVAKDITERRQAIEEKERFEAQFHQAQKMESLGKLAGGIAHDFNNLLMGIQGRSSLMMLDTDASHPHFEHLKGIEDYIQSATALTKQLLGFARGGKYEVKATDLNELIKSQSLMFSRTKKEISFHEQYEEDLWLVEVDQGQMQQMLLNIYINAWHAMPGGGDIYIHTQNVKLDRSYIKPYRLKPGEYVKISITDTGVGMDEATKQKIFDPFFTTKEMGRGTGLGLASVYGIVKNHGGFINVYSVKGEGATFNIYLPTSKKQIVKEKKVSSKKIMKGSETVLLVDDEDMLIVVGKKMLKALGYEALTARNGEEAVEIYKNNRDKIDIVLLDMIMPGLSGSKTYNKLKEINPDIRVLLLSGYSMNGKAVEILNRGCNGFLQKPFSLEALSRKIKEICQGYE